MLLLRPRQDATIVLAKRIEWVSSITRSLVESPSLADGRVKVFLSYPTPEVNRNTVSRFGHR